MITWAHIFPGSQTVQMIVLSAMDKEQARRNAIFADSNARKQLFSSIQNSTYFETNAMSANGERETGAMFAADIAYKIDGLLNKMLTEFEVY